MLSTAGFTCVAFVTGALAWWAPTYLQLGFELLPNQENIDPEKYVFQEIYRSICMRISTRVSLCVYINLCSIT